MTIAGPLLVIGLPLVTAGVLILLRRWTVITAWVAAFVAAALGVLIAVVPQGVLYSLFRWSVALDEPISILGRKLVIEPVDRLPLVFIFITASVLYLVAWRILPRSSFFPVGSAITGLLSAALMVEQVVYAALLVEMAAILGVLPLHEPVVSRDGTSYGGTTKGGLQYITYTTLALPGLMITQLLLEQYALFPGDLSLLRTATILLGLSFAILLGAVPFQSWLSTVATDGTPPVVTFLFTVNLGTVWFMLLAYLESYSWLSEQTLFGPLFVTVGLVMMFLGGLLAASQRRLGRIVGYATLVDNGAMLIALGTRRVAGLSLALMLLVARPLALGLMTLGLDGLRRLTASKDGNVEDLQGAAWVAPWRTLAYIVGGIALAGFPITLSFSARWGIYQLLAEENLFQAILALLGSSGVMMGLIASLRVLLSPAKIQGGSERTKEDPVVLVLILTLIAIIAVLGIFPQPVSELAFDMADAFTFIGQ